MMMMLSSAWLKTSEEVNGYVGPSWFHIRWRRNKFGLHQIPSGPLLREGTFDEDDRWLGGIWPLEEFVPF